MVERIALTGIGVFLLFGLRIVLKWSTHRYRRQRAVDLLPVGEHRSSWFILAFSTSGCVACHTVQEPALEELAQHFPGKVAVRHIDATNAPDLVRRFGIFTVPSTVVLDHEGWVLAINHSPTGASKLANQLTERKNHPSMTGSTIRESGRASLKRTI